MFGHGHAGIVKGLSGSVRSACAVYLPYSDIQDNLQNRDKQAR